MRDSYYFSHDCNAANDQRILKLRTRFNNAEGYGIYFFILEAMSQEEYGILESDCVAQLSLSYGLAIEQLQAVLNFCIEVGLFIQDQKGIYSKRMVEHKKFRKERSESGKRGAASRWNDGSAIGSANGSAYAKERKGKEIKEKEIKEKFNKKKFDRFGNYYTEREGSGMSTVADILGGSL